MSSLTSQRKKDSLSHSLEANPFNEIFSRVFLLIEFYRVYENGGEDGRKKIDATG